MPRVKVCIEPLGPVTIGFGLSQSNVLLTREFIPGSAVRGALAAHILNGLGRRNYAGRGYYEGAGDPSFGDIFLSDGAARFGFMYPTNLPPQDALKAEAFPVPLTAWTCKTHKGFPRDGGHGVFDRLAGWISREESGKADELTACPKCGDRIDRFRALAVRDQVAVSRAKVERSQKVRVGLNRGTETAEEEVLYVVEVVEPPGNDRLSWVGCWWISEDQLNTLKAMLDEHCVPDGNAWRVRIGTARSRGLGECRLWVGEEESRVSIEERLSGFQVDRARSLYFALTLKSPCLLLSRYGMPAAEPSPEVLREYFGGVPEGMEFLPQASVLEREVWSGWCSAWGLPKPLVMPWAAGSVMAFRAPADQKGAVLEFLDKVESTGLGERVAGGWGEATACDPFHVDFGRWRNASGEQEHSRGFG